MEKLDERNTGSVFDIVADTIDEYRRGEFSIWNAFGFVAAIGIGSYMVLHGF